MENTTDIWTAPVTLAGRKLKLEPASLEHLDSLAENLLHPQSWHGVHWGILTKEDLKKVMLERAIKARRDFLEISGTWVSHYYQKSFVNTEAKLLMLSYVFETLGCLRVEFRVDSLNFNSQRAVLRLGAKYEGELRQTALLPDGRKRDYRIYSILDSEWINCKLTLTQYLDKYV